MTLRAMARSTPFRLTLRLMAIFAAAMLGCFAVAFLAIRSYLDTDLHNQVSQEIAAWQTATDAADLTERVADVVGSTPPRSEIIGLVTGDGRKISNVPGFGPVTGFRVVSASEIDLPADNLADSYLVSSAPVPGGTLILGRDREKVSELGEIFLMVFLIGVLPTLALAGGLGLVTAQWTRTRVEAISGALLTITAGDLEARVPDVSVRGDDLDRIGAAVNQMAAAQAASTASLRQVSADIAHDLKTPIQRVSVLLDLLESAGPLSEAQEKALGRARAETRQIAATFQSLLQIAQIEGGKTKARFAPVDLAEVVSDIVDVYVPSAEESGHRLTWRPPVAPVKVQGDRNLLGQIVANLIENGLRHTPPGSRIALALGASGVVTITDDGPGIPAEERKNVLRRLYRLERSRTTEGSGLGLSLVAAIADLHGAALALDDAGPGLRAELRFPLASAV